MTTSTSQQAQLDAACRQLIDSDRPWTEIAGDLGASPESLGADFESRLRLAPEAFRRLRGAGEWRFELPRWWRREDTAGFWGRDPKSLQERALPRRLAWALRSPSGPLGLELELGDAGRGARALLAGPGAKDEGAAAWAHRVLVRLLGLHLDPAAFEDQVRQGPHARLIERRPGLTIPQAPSVFDGVVWVICGQQVSLAVAFSLRRKLTERFGTPLAGTGLVAPPGAAELAAADPDELGRLGLSRRKTEYLHDLAAQVSDDDAPFALEALRGRQPAEVEERLLAVRGFGPWSVHYLMMRALGLPDCVPVGDAGLKRALERCFGLDGRPDAETTQRLMRPFAPHRSLATFHLWASLQDDPRAR